MDGLRCCAWRSRPYQPLDEAPLGPLVFWTRADTSLELANRRPSALTEARPEPESILFMGGKNQLPRTGPSNHARRGLYAPGRRNCSTARTSSGESSAPRTGSERISRRTLRNSLSGNLSIVGRFDALVNEQDLNSVGNKVIKSWPAIGRQGFVRSRRKIRV